MRLTHLQAQLVTAQVCRGETFLAVGSGSVHHVQDKVWPPLCVVYHHHVAVLTLECLLGEGLLGGIGLSTDHSSCHTPRAVGRCQNSIPRSGRGLVRGVMTVRGHRSWWGSPLGLSLSHPSCRQRSGAGCWRQSMIVHGEESLARVGGFWFASRLTNVTTV